MQTLITAAALVALTIPAAAQVQQPAAAPAPAASGRQAQAERPAYKKITRAQFDALLKEPATVLVLDVRRPDEQQTIGAFPVFLSIQAKDLEQQLDHLPKDRAIVTVSNHAGRAGKAAELLEKKGFNVAGSIGVQDYEAEGGTLAKVTPRPTPAAAH